MSEHPVVSSSTLTVEQALLDLPTEVAASYRRDRRSLRADIESRIAASSSSDQRFITMESDNVAALGDRVELGPRRRLAAVISLLESAQTSAPRTLATRLTRAIDLARRADEGLTDLAAGGFTRLGTPQDLRDALADLTAGGHATIQLDVEIEDASDEALRSAYFVVSEALANVAKHAGAERVQVSVRHAGRDLVVEVTDDGAGGANPEGAGLRGLARRLAEHGGRLEVMPSETGGTTVRAAMPT